MKKLQLTMFMQNSLNEVVCIHYNSDLFQFLIMLQLCLFVSYIARFNQTKLTLFTLDLCASSFYLRSLRSPLLLFVMMHVYIARIIWPHQQDLYMHFSMLRGHKIKMRRKQRRVNLKGLLPPCRRRILCSQIKTSEKYIIEIICTTTFQSEFCAVQLEIRIKSGRTSERRNSESLYCM